MSFKRGRGFGFGGFNFVKPSSSSHQGGAMIPPPSSDNYPPPLIPGLTSRPGNVLRPQSAKRYSSEQDYFEGGESDEEKPYLPNSDSEDETNGGGNDDDSEDDPLEMFMANIEKSMNKEKSKDKIAEKPVKKSKRTDIEDLDEQEEYFKYMEENPNAGLLPDDEEVDYDEDGNPIYVQKTKMIQPLPVIYHSEIDYPEFNKNFYEQHEDIAKLTYINVVELRKKLGIKVSGYDPPKPVTSFGHFGFDEQLMHYIRKSEYSQPTPIQAQGIPAGLSGRDVIGIAKTGSGKTAAFIWPLLVHIMDQKPLQDGDGPIGVICAPTRELAQQIHSECKRFGKAYNIHSVCAYGGGSMWEQTKACQEGTEIIVATPGRLIDLIKKKATNLLRCTYLVLDEADRMFDMGFEPQVRSIANHVRPDRQTLLFSATFRKKVEQLARDILTDPIRIVQGDIGEANEDVTQLVEVLKEAVDKWNWLIQRLVSFTSEGSVLIFVTKKLNCEELTNNLKLKDFHVNVLQGDMDQIDRNKVITRFKKKEFPILVATDVAARGLDIPAIKTVINFDVARDIDTHTHRIGRTGRAGEKGTAYTLVTAKDVNFAGDLVRNLEGANQAVPHPLMELAMQSSWFNKSRFKRGKGKKMNQTGGLGYRDRPGLGSSARGPSTSVGGASTGARPGPTNFKGFVSSGGGRGGRGGDGGGECEGDTASSKSHGPMSSGSQGNRYSAVKNAFLNQYKTHFQAASNDTASSTSTIIEKNKTQPPPPGGNSGVFKTPELPPPQPRKKKSRWDS